MPIYQWECISCGHSFESMQKMGAHNPECPICRGETRKLPTAGNFKLIGGGWADQGYQKKRG
ncbi:zinc ribbon domain-containing protein [Candidatus Pacearchaeota archaeon]|nr:zinc ribbon domain-containing protein [Candidatus Pacearchaeota archaeon]